MKIFISIFSNRLVQGVTIEYPQSAHIEERIRTDVNSIDPIFRHYIIPREIQFHADALQGRLSFFLKCKGSRTSIQLTVPPSAIDVKTTHILKLV